MNSKLGVHAKLLDNHMEGEGVKAICEALNSQRITKLDISGML